MKLVIDIPEEDYAVILANADIVNKRKKHTLEEAVLNGIPLPKGHGRLIDENQIDTVELEDSITFMRYTKGGEVDLRIDTPTIIEAEREESMSKEEQIRKQQTKELIDELSKMPSMVIATAYLYAINYTLYGEDVTEKWLTATQQTSALEKAYRKGYYDALQKQAESEE